MSTLKQLGSAIKQFGEINHAHLPLSIAAERAVPGRQICAFERRINPGNLRHRRGDLGLLARVRLDGDVASAGGGNRPSSEGALADASCGGVSIGRPAKGPWPWPA